MKPLFEYRAGLNQRKEKALRMIRDGHSPAEVCLELQLSAATLKAWLKAGLPAGDPDLDQLSLVDGLTERERQQK